MERKEQTAQGANYWSQRRDAQLSRGRTGGREAEMLGGLAPAPNMPSDPALLFLDTNSCKLFFNNFVFFLFFDHAHGMRKYPGQKSN